MSYRSKKANKKLPAGMIKVQKFIDSVFSENIKQIRITDRLNMSIRDQSER